MKNGLKVGLKTRLYEYGVNQHEMPWKDGVKEGLKSLWYESGEKKHGDTLWIRMKT